MGLDPLLVASQLFSFSTLVLLVGSLTCKTLPDDLYCVGGDVKPYSLTISFISKYLKYHWEWFCHRRTLWVKLIAVEERALLVSPWHC